MTYGGLTSAAVATAGGDRVGVILGLTPAWNGATAVGPAATAEGPAGDNLAVHRALAEAPRGSVLVVALTGNTPAGHWGELMTAAAEAAGVVGVVVAGTIRDGAQIEARRFPVFHRGRAPRPATKVAPGAVGGPVVVDGVQIAPGDLVVADGDGVAVVPTAHVAAVIAAVEELETREAGLLLEVERGASTVDVLGLAGS